MVYLILIIFFRSHIYLFRKSAFYLWKHPKWVKNGCFLVIRWKVGENFVGENDVLRLYLSIKKYRFCSVWCTRFWLKVLVFLFLNTVKWFEQKINAYGDLLQNERHVLKHVSSLQNEKSRFSSVFQVYKMKQHVVFT